MTEPTTPAGAMPVAGGATPPQTPPAPPPAAPTTSAADTPAPAPAPAAPATGDSDGLGDAGKQTLDKIRGEKRAAEDRAKAAERALADLKAASLSDSEKAIAEAKAAGASEVMARVTARIRQSEARAALIAAGATPTLVDLAVRSDEFAALKVDDEGQIDGLDDAVTAFRKAHPEIFAKAAPASPGSADQGARPPGSPKATDLTSAIAQRYGSTR